MSLDGLSINLATVREQFTLGHAIDACVKHGIRAVAPWRDQVAKAGLKEAAAMVRAGRRLSHTTQNEISVATLKIVKARANDFVR